jgi:hypothetical protein
MAKKVSKKQSKKLEQYRGVAQVVTVGSAVAYGFLWAGTGIFTDTDPNWVEAVGKVLIAATVGGGIVMGLLYSMVPDKKNKK